MNSKDATSDASIDMKLEVVVIPVSDVDRTKEFYGNLQVETRRRLPLRQRVPGRPVHATWLRMLNPIRHEHHVGRAKLGPRSLPDRLEHRGCPRRIGRPWY